ncbi:hypothetical protein D9619_012621 [Psilocybe cf. subviscida]|uniref:F-box domain-containing protein n=1 Tax=Psilocybe cf. subviscida TaxID=2480587 RepID=A0A8H5EZH5_9AGAR|nr:hypothetical protein D9619_012621 [Psilocybe cf. subviscida]
MAPQNLCFSDFPAEIIAHIFLQGTISQQATSPYSLPYPFLVSEVCTTWRNIALSSPALWTLVVVPIFYQPAGLFCMTLTNNWIKRSGALPISVILDARFSWRRAEDDKEVVSPGFITMMLQSVVESAGDKLRRLDICIPYHPTFGHKDYALLERATSLEQLRVVSASMPMASELVSGAFFDRSDLWDGISLPQLRKLGWSSSGIPLLTNLTTFSAPALSMTYDEMGTFFRGSPHISHLILDDIRPIRGVPQPPPDERIQVPSLTHVAIKCYREIGLHEAHVFTFLHIDHLTYLELDGTMSVTQLFGSSIPHIAESLRDLMIANYSDASLMKNSVDGKRDVAAIQSFHGLQHFYFLNAPSQIFKVNLTELQTSRNSSIRRSGSISRLRSEQTRESRIDPTLAVYQRARPKNIINESTLTGSEPSMWPCLRHVTFDSLAALDISILCNWIKDHRTLAVLDLSDMALRHVVGSLRRRGDVIFPAGWKPYAPLIHNEDTEALRDVKDWISARVQLRVMKEKCCGMLYNRVFNALGEELP